MKTGPIADNWWTAERLFWEQETNEENEMSNADYKRGVEDATKPMRYDDPVYTDPNRGGLSYFDFANAVIANRRKTLLTKKVTKWFAVYNNDNSGSLRIVGQFTNGPGNGLGLAELFETEQEALNRIKYITTGVGAFPIEVEVEL
jgi:hypothetical protein